MTTQAQQQEFEAAIQLHIQQAVAAALVGLPLPAAPAPPTVNVNAVAVKLPEFWPADPNTWFHQAEAAFRRSNVTQSFTKYDHVLMKLPTDVVMSVRDLVNSMQPNTPTSSGTPRRATPASAPSPMPASLPLPIVHPHAVRRTAAVAAPDKDASRHPDPIRAAAMPPLSVSTTAGSDREQTNASLPVPGRKTRPPPWASQCPRRPSLPPGRQK
jgi:hypothetical protein